jgi:probable selenate reductase FAD-binding subunit
MFNRVEQFHMPSDVHEAVRLLQRGKGKARVVAGGTDFTLQSDDSVRILIDITRAGLSYIRPKRGLLAIGATTTMTDLEESPSVRTLAGGILAHAAASCGSVQVRNIATIGGNMAHGSPAADLAPPLLALDAAVVLASARSRQKLGIGHYLAMQAQRKGANSLLVEIQIPQKPSGAHRGWSFQKLGRTAVDISLVSVAAGLELDAHGKLKWARIALGAVAPMAIRAAETEKLITGRILDRNLLEEAGTAVKREVSPISDHRASADYRREMSGVLLRRALEECAAESRWTL